jgi:hypothetical protein
MESILERKMYQFKLYMITKRFLSKTNCWKQKTTAKTLRLFELAWKSFKTTIENDNVKKLNIVDFFDKNNKVIDGNILNSGDLVSIKCYIRYWRHFISKQHKLTLELAAIKLLDHVNLIKHNYDIHMFIIWTQRL